jgi:hypothetical protein
VAFNRRFVTQPAKLLQVLVALSVIGMAAACEERKIEPTSSRPVQTVKPAKTLEWTPPPTWNVERTAKSGEYRAKYTIPTTGDSKHPAELLVSKLGTGKKADVDAKLDALLAEFEGEGVKAAQRKELQVGDFVVKVLEVGATYKFPMGPVGPNQKRAAHVIKDNWRAIGAGVETKDRGNWFFRFVGPNDTVEGSRSAFMAMLENLR